MWSRISSFCLIRHEERSASVENGCKTRRSVGRLYTATESIMVGEAVQPRGAKQPRERDCRIFCLLKELLLPIVMC